MEKHTPKIEFKKTNSGHNKNGHYSFVHYEMRYLYTSWGESQLKFSDFRKKNVIKKWIGENVHNTAIESIRRIYQRPCFEVILRDKSRLFFTEYSVHSSLTQTTQKAR